MKAATKGFTPMGQNPKETPQYPERFSKSFESFGIQNLFEE